MLTATTLHPARWWHALPDGRVQCDLCPRDCQLHEGQRGACFVRQMVNGAMQLTTYGRSSGFCIDPIEKKPLNHFYPGSSILSFGTAGCVDLNTLDTNNNNEFRKANNVINKHESVNRYYL